MGRQKTKVLTLAVCLFISWSVAQGSDNGTSGGNINDWIDGLREEGCYDSQGQLISHGSKYVPNSNDPCTECTCDKTFPVRCHSVACSPPLHCKPLENTCCEYVCNGTRPVETDPDDGESITNLSLRLIASTVTSFLVLALLLFLVHRVRQRRLLLSMRRFEERAQQVHSEDTDSEHYIPEIFMSVECPPYTDPPPPYSPPKPPQILPGEQPPPYDELGQNGDANGNSADENSNQITALQERSSEQQPQGEAYRLTELSRSVGRDAVGPRSNQQQVSSLEMHCQEWSGPHPERARENVHLEQQVASQRPARANDYCMEMRRETEPGCVSYSLPAYACTDIVGHVGMVFSPEEAQASYFPSMAESSRYQGARDTIYDRGQPQRLSARSVGDTRPSQRQSCESHSSRRRRQEGSARGSTYAAQTLPATTAFQRFSNLFKRNSWRAKNRRRHQNSSHIRGLSEMCTANTPAQYSTLPGGEYRSPVSNLYTGYDLSACNFYPTTASPSSSSSNSSCGGDQIVADSNHPLGQRFPHSPNEAGHWNFNNSNQTRNMNHGQGTSRRNLPRGDRSHFVHPESHLLPCYPEQFQDDLRRHLPPVCRQSANFTSSQSRNNREISPRPMTCYSDVRSENTGPAHSISLPLRDLGCGPQESNFETAGSTSRCDRRRGQSSSDNRITCDSDIPGVVPQPLTQTELTVSNPQRSLASLICSNPPIASAAHSTNKSYDLIDSTGTRRNDNLPNEMPVRQCSNSNVGMIRNSLDSEGAPIDPVRTSNSSAEDHSLPGDGSLQRLQHLPSLHQSSGLTSTPKPFPNSSTVDTTEEHGAIRRSHSDTSEGSLFSVCSETGEQKLKGTPIRLTTGADIPFDPETMALPADSPYPQHPSLVSGIRSPPVGKANNVSSGVDNFPGCDNDVGSALKTVSSCSGDGMISGASTSTDHSTQVKKIYDESPEFAFSKELNQTGIKKPCSENDSMPNGSKVFSDDRADLNYNLNISPLARKRLASKDLQPVVGSQEGDRMVKSVNLPPLSSLSRSLTQRDIEEYPSRTIDSTLYDLESTIDARDSSGKVADVSKKRLKKAGARRSSSPISSYHGGARQKNSLPLSNGKDFSGEADLKLGKSSSRRRTQQKFSNPMHPQLSSDLSNAVSSQFSGNPERYPGGPKGRVPTATGMVHVLQPDESVTGPVYTPTAGQSDSSADANVIQGMNDLNQPPKKLIGLYDVDGYNNGPNSLVHPSHTAVSKQPVAQQPRRKDGSGQPHHQHHRRQASAGVIDKNALRAASPSRRRPRPKSLAAPYEMDRGKYPKHNTSTPSTGLRQDSDSCFGRVGARSGFGCDMNLDDENGMADFHIGAIMPSMSNQNKTISGYAAIVGTALPPKQAFKPDGQHCSQDYGVAGVPQINAVCGPNTNTKSGPSKDLSFVGRSASGKEKSSGVNRNRKKQPLTAPVDPAHCFSHVNGHLSRNGTYNQWCSQARVGNLARALSEEDVREATSYV